MARADVYIHYDDVQYDKHGWRNRNRLWISDRPQWITIPVSQPNGSLNTLIRDVRIAEPEWVDRHTKLIEAALGSATHFHELKDLILPALRHAHHLVDVTIPTLEKIARLLAIRVHFLRSSELGVGGRGTERLVELCQSVGASTYLSGPAAREYLDESQFTRGAIRVEWMEYAVPKYRQLHAPFDPHVSVLDPIANLGVLGTQALLH